MNQIMCQAIQQEYLVLRTNGGPICITAKLSTVWDRGLAAENHIPQAQANVVRRKLAGTKTVTELVARLDEMVCTGIARFSGTDTCKLNDKTIAVLRRYL